MARCYRCEACQSMWDTSPCKNCGFPGDETRSPEKIEQDARDWAEYNEDDDDAE